MWGPDPAFTFNYNNFFGVDHDTGNQSVGGIDCNFLGCFGAELRGRVDIHAGIDLGVSIHSGLVNHAQPTSIGLGFPDQVTIGLAGGGFQVSSSQLFGTGTVTTVSPELQAFADLEFALTAMLGGEVCAFACAGGDVTLVDFVADDFELLAFNRNSDGQLRVAGSAVNLPLTAARFLENSLTLDVDLPNIETTGSGSPPPPIIAQGTDDSIIGLDLNVVNAATFVARRAGVPIPPLSDRVSIGPLPLFNYNLLSAGVGMDLGASQMFSLLPSVIVQLDVLETGQQVRFRGGQASPALLFPDGTESGDVLTVKPTFFMDSAFSNLTQLLISGNLFASAGEFSIPALGLSLGPLFDVTLPLGSLPINVFNESFTLAGYDSFMGETFQVTAINPLETPIAVRAPASLMLLASALGVASICRRRGRGNSERRTMRRIALYADQPGL
jgi:hypothetical protein